MKRALLLIILFAALVLGPSAALAQDHFFDSTGVRIRYLESGRGTPVVLVHGIGGRADDWLDSGVLQNLARDYHVIALDLRGHGSSDKPRDADAYGSELGLDIGRLLDHLNVPRAHVVSYSLGSTVVAQWLTIHPERFITVTLGGGGGLYSWSSAEQAEADQIATELEREGISRTLLTRTAPPGRAPTEEEFKQRAEAARLSGRDRYAEAALVRARGAMVVSPDDAARVQVPTLGIAGSLDPNLASLRTLQTLRPGITVLTIEGATHTGVGDARRRPEFAAWGC